MYKKLTHILIANPKKIFLIDFSGAIMSLSSLLLISRYFNAYFDIPDEVVKYLSIGALILILYSFSCLLFLKNTCVKFIKILAFSNILYCFLTILIAILFFKQITLLAVLYFAIELSVISIIIALEFSIAKGIMNKQNIKS